MPVGIALSPRLRRWAVRLPLAYLCLSVLAVGVVWWVGRSDEPSAALPSEPAGAGTVSLRRHGDLPERDADAREPSGRRRPPATSRDGHVPADRAGSRRTTRQSSAASTDRHPPRSRAEWMERTERSDAAAAWGRERRSGTRRGTPRPSAGSRPPTTTDPASTTTVTTTPATGTTTPTTATTTPTTGTTAPPAWTARRSRRSHR